MEILNSSLFCVIQIFLTVGQFKLICCRFLLAKDTQSNYCDVWSSQHLSISLFMEWTNLFAQTHNLLKVAWMVQRYWPG